MQIDNLKKYLTLITLMAVSVTGVQIGKIAIASAVAPKAQPALMLAANTGLCSFITGNNVNVRKGPGTQYPSVAELNRGDGVVAVNRRGNWVEISAKRITRRGSARETLQPLRGWVLNAYINGCSEDQFDMWRQ